MPSGISWVGLCRLHAQGMPQDEQSPLLALDNILPLHLRLL